LKKQTDVEEKDKINQKVGARRRRECGRGQIVCGRMILVGGNKKEKRKKRKEQGGEQEDEKVQDKDEEVEKENEKEGAKEKDNLGSVAMLTI
jgi:hypothetical protein